MIQRKAGSISDYRLKVMENTLIGFKISIIVLSKFTNFDQKKELLILINKNSVLALISFVVLVIFLTIGPTFDIFFSGLFWGDIFAESRGPVRA